MDRTEALHRIDTIHRIETIQRIKEAEIRDYGASNDLLYEKLCAAAENGSTVEVNEKDKFSTERGKAARLIIGLNNADTKGFLLKILKEEIKKIIRGIKLTETLMEASESIFYLPEYAKGFESVSEELRLEGITVCHDFIDVRSHKDDMLVHFITMLHVCDLMDGNYEDVVYIADGEDIRRYAPELTVGEAAHDLYGYNSGDKIKGFIIGSKATLRGAETLTLREADIWNGRLKVLTDADCMVCETRNELLELRERSCGRCVFCREGLLQLEQMQKDISEGRGKPEYLDYTEEIGTAMGFSTMCTLGERASEFALHAVSAFRDEEVSHIKKKKCEAGVCFSSVMFYIDPKSCSGCQDCMDVCPADCIEGKPGYIHMIDTIDCTACGSCLSACGEDAVQKTDGKLPRLPNRLTKVGRFRK